MPSQQKAKTTHGTRYDGCRSGKAWKAGKSPEIRLAEAKKKAADKVTRKGSASE